MRRIGSRLALLLALAVDLFSFGDSPLVRGPSQASLHAALAAQAQVTGDWLAMDGVVGTAVGLDRTRDYVLTVYVTSPRVAVLPSTIAEVPVRIVVTGRFVSLSDPPPETIPAEAEDVDPKAGFPRPVPIGVSAGHPDVTAGTIGARVTDGSKVFALSNNHVFAARNLAQAGDNLLQPGVADGGKNPDDALATLFDFEPIEFCRGLVCPSNRLDAALGLTTVDDLGTGTPEGGYGSPRSATIEAKLGTRVQKYGRTTGLTEGRVTGINAVIDVDYRTGTARFVDQVVISGDGFSAGGDSGSLVVTKGLLMADRRPVGLLFAGSEVTTLANPIDLVLDRFGVSVEGG